MLLLLFQSHFLGLVLAQSATESAGLLVAQVTWRALGILVGCTGGGSSLFGDDSEDAGDSFSHGLAERMSSLWVLTLILVNLTWGWDET